MKIKINIFCVLGGLVAMILIQPPYLEEILWLDVTWNAMKIIVSFFILVLFGLKGKMTRILRIVIFFQCILLGSTLLQEKPLWSFFLQCAYMVVFLLLMQLFLKEGKLRYLVQGMSIVFGGYSIINTITCFCFPQGLYVNAAGFHSCWFLGYDNTALPIILGAEILCLYDSLLRKKRISTYVYIVYGAGLLFCFKNEIATAILAQMVFLVLIVLEGKFSMKITTLKKGVVANIIIFIGIVVFHMQRYLAPFFKLLGKDITFTGRTILWERTLKAALDSVWVGNGVTEGNGFMQHVGGGVVGYSCT